MFLQAAKKGLQFKVPKKSFDPYYVASAEVLCSLHSLNARRDLGLTEQNLHSAGPSKSDGSKKFTKNHTASRYSNEISKHLSCFTGLLSRPRPLYLDNIRYFGGRVNVAFFSSSTQLKTLNKIEQDKNKKLENEDKDNIDNKNIDRKQTGALAKFKGIVNTFWLGCKQLMWVDARKAWATKKKLKRHDYDLTILTREELRHMRQTRKDMIKSLPVALLFFLPFIGYFAPIIGFLFPKRLLSHQFWDIEQRKKFAFEDHIKRSQYYLPLIQEVGWSSRELKNQELFKLCIKAIDANQIENNDLLPLKDVFYEDIMVIKKMPRFHLQKLCKTWLLPVKWYVPSKVLQEFLASRIKQIIEDDDAIRRESVDALTDLCIRQACHARGLDKSSFDIPVMKEWLEDWMHLTQKVTDANLSFVAHCAAFKTINFGKPVQNISADIDSQTGNEAEKGSSNVKH